MSEIHVDTLKNKAGTGAPDFPEGVTVTGVGTITGDLSVSGTVTYDDVTSVDSVGIVTARNGFRATAGGINVVAGVSTFANQIDANGCIDATGIVTASHGFRATTGGINIVSGVSTFANQIDANGSVDVAGIVTASHGFRATTGGLNIVAGVSTIAEDAKFSATTGTGTTIGLGGVNVSGIVTATSFDGGGNVPAGQTGSVTLAASDTGRFVSASGGITVPASTSNFATGDVISIYNNTGGNITITCSAPTAVYLGSDGSTKTSLTLTTRCICTLICVDASSNGTFVATGGGLA